MGSKTAIAVIIGSSLLCCGDSARNEETYSLTSMGGQRIVIAKNLPAREYSITIADVTVRSSACDEEHNRICLSTDSLDLVAPIIPPEANSSWEVKRARFWLEAIVGSLRLLGHTFKDVYVIRGRRDLDTGTRGFRFYFSYADGLLAYQELMNAGASPLFITSDLPSLGHASVPD